MAKSNPAASSPPPLKSIASPPNLPIAQDLEEAVIGAILLSSSAMALVKTVFKDPYVFHTKRCRVTFQCALYLDMRNRPIDLLTIQAEIMRRGKATVCSPTDLVELTGKVASSANTEYHCRILYQTYMRRVAITESQKLMAAASDPKLDIFDLYEKAYVSLKRSDPSGVLKLSTVNSSLVVGSKMERQKRMVGSLLCERDLAIFFGDEGTGKSILSYQIGDAVSKGKNFLDNADLSNECEPKEVIMFDFEMIERELFDRYSAEGMFYSFSENFYRANMDESWTDMENLADRIIDHIEVIIKTNKPDLAIIDNLTWICDETTDNTIAARVMKKLDALRKLLPPLAILVIAHTPKRDRSQPLESRHLAGAKSLSNFCTSLFGISESMRDSGIRYVKQLKCRGDQKVFTGDNVLELTLIKESARIEMEYIGTSAELEHLQYIDLADKEDAINSSIMDLKTKGYGMRKIAREILQIHGVKMSHQTVSRRYKRLLQEEADAF